MDYPAQRLKILAKARVLAPQEHQRIADRLSPSIALRRRVERLVLLDIVAFDWNCPGYITPRFTESEIAAATAPLHRKIAELEAEVARAKTLAS